MSREGHSDSDSVIIADGDVNVLKRKRSSSSSSYGKRDSGALESPQPGVFELQVCCLKFRWLTGPSSKRNVTSELSPMASLPAVIVDTQVDDESADVTGPPSTFPAVRKRRVLK